MTSTTTYWVPLLGAPTEEIRTAVEATGARYTGWSHEAGLNGTESHSVLIDGVSRENVIERLEAALRGLGCSVTVDQVRPFESS